MTPFRPFNKNYLKSLINGLFGLIGLRIIRSNKSSLTGRYLFEDLSLLMPEPRPICLDVGANVGQTIDNLLAHLDHPLIFSFEPSTESFAVLSSKHYPANVEINKYALGAQASESLLFNYDNSELSSIRPFTAHDSNPYSSIGLKSVESIRVDTVDNFLQYHRIKKVDLLKIDTQGYERDVLIGARNSLRTESIRFVMAELNFINIYEGQASALELLELLSESRMGLVDFYEKIYKNNRLAGCTALFARL